MSDEQDQVRALAERVARRVAQTAGDRKERGGAEEHAGEVVGELAAMRASLEELQKRLARIESHVADEEDEPVRLTRDARRSEPSQGYDREQKVAAPAPFAAAVPPVTRSPWLSGVYVPVTHPSQERFGVDEATVSELVDFFESEKSCSLEPGKPCDHCAMCSSRGF